MPNRILRDYTDSDRVDRLSAAGERFYVRLFMKADDFGRLYADPRKLKSALFPLRDTVCVKDIQDWLAECERAELIRFYDVDGKRYLELWKFGQRLRNMRNIHPKPPSDLWKCDNSQQPAATRSEQPPESESESESETESESGKPKRTPFAPPAIDSILLQCDKIALPHSEGQKFFDFYSSKGWMVGKSRMKSWVHALSGWQSRWREYYGNQNSNSTGKPNIRNAGVTVGPTAYGTTKPRAQREREAAKMAGSVPANGDHPPANSGSS